MTEFLCYQFLGNDLVLLVIVSASLSLQITQLRKLLLGFPLRVNDPDLLHFFLPNHRTFLFYMTFPCHISPCLITIKLVPVVVLKTLVCFIKTRLMIWTIGLYPKSTLILLSPGCEFFFFCKKIFFSQVLSSDPPSKYWTLPSLPLGSFSPWSSLSTKFQV